MIISFLLSKLLSVNAFVPLDAKRYFRDVRSIQSLMPEDKLSAAYIDHDRH